MGAEAMQHEQLPVEEEEAKQAQLHIEIAEAERRQKALERQYAAAKKGQSVAGEQLGFVKELNQSLLANRREIQAASSGNSNVEAGNSEITAAGNEEGEDDPLVKRLRERVTQLMMAVSAMEGS